MTVLLKAGALLLAAFSLVSASPPPMTLERLVTILPATEPEQPDVVFQNYPLVARMDCDHARGTAFRVGENHWYSVAHVTAHPPCHTQGLPIAVTEQDDSNDFSRFDTAATPANGFGIDCNGFQAGHWYWAVGHALGAPFQTAVAIYATIYESNASGNRILVGKHTVIPGMSGGPVIDPSTGLVVGTINAYDAEHYLSFSRALKDTSACNHGD